MHSLFKYFLVGSTLASVAFAVEWQLNYTVEIKGTATFELAADSQKNLTFYGRPM